MRIVFDANVLVSGLTRQSAGAPSILMTMWQQDSFDVVLSGHIISKVADAWRKPYCQAFFTEVEILENVRKLSMLARIIGPISGIQGMAEDDEDDTVLATAEAANADLLVTGDKYMQSLSEFRGIPILSPREFLDMLLNP